MIQKIFIAVIFLFGISGLNAQNLDRGTLSSGGNSVEGLSFVLGEVFNFSMAGGDITFESGSQSSIDNTGWLTTLNEIENLHLMTCFPNPVKDDLHINLPKVDNTSFLVKVYNTEGKLIQSGQIHDNYSVYNVSNLSFGNYFLSVSNSEDKIIGVVKFIKE